MESQNRIVHGLWVGASLSPLEELCLRSFVAKGHEFHLWLYEPLSHGLPAGVVQRPAAKILPSSSIFRYRHGNSFGHGKGSLAGFSDLFRYKLLYEEGGWWADMDVTCLRPLDFEAPYVFRRHDVLPAVGNLMKCPKGSPLMAACFQEAQERVTAENQDWLLPIRILNKHICNYQLESFIVDITNQDRWEVVEYYLHHNRHFAPKWHAFHWMNEEWRSRGLDKTAAIPRSALGRLLKSYAIPVKVIPQHFFQASRLWLGLKMGLLPRIPHPLRLAVKSSLLFLARLGASTRRITPKAFEK